MARYIILHNVRSAHNVGSIFRTADGAGVAKIFLCGYTPAPLDRFGRVVPDIAKTALGATDSVPWEQCEDTSACIRACIRNGIRVVAVEQHEHALPYTKRVSADDVAFVFGNEIEGVPDAVLEEVQEIVHIPMHGVKESLNVGISVGIILFHDVAGVSEL